MFIKLPEDVSFIVENAADLQGKTVEQIIIEKLREGTFEKDFTSELKSNLLKLDEIKLLKRGWDSKAFRPIPKKVILKAKQLILNLDKQPELLPTTWRKIQFVYNGNNNSILKLDIGRLSIIEYEKVDKAGNKSRGAIPFAAYALNSLVDEFYNE